MKTVVVIGGGASGLMAALTAASDSENKIIILERQQRVGKKLLATGNGRCNLTNTGAAPSNYHGEQPSFAEFALSQFTPEDTLKFFRKLGLLTVTEYGGRVYPLSNSANSVLDVLRFALEKPNIELRCSSPVREIKRRGEGFLVVCDEDKIAADYVIMACGGCAGSKIGGVTDGYELLAALGHKRTALRPSLVQLITDTSYPRSLKGVRANAQLELLQNGEAVMQSRGEMQFTETGISGPASFDISRAASFGGAECEVKLDFLADYDEQAVLALLKQRCAAQPELPAEELLTGMVHNRLGKMLVKYSEVGGGRELKTLTDAELMKIARACKGFALKVKGVEGFDCAQVTAGGIKTTGVNPETMESWFVPHLFICGELLDIDGDCGGYNLQWAWASGHLAGRLGK